MARFNALKAMEVLNLTIEYHTNFYRLLIILDDPSSDYYNPDAASTIRNLLSEISKGGSLNTKKRERMIVSFLGQYESLLVSLQTDLNVYSTRLLMTDYIERITGRATDFSKVSNGLFKLSTKFDLEEKINSLLYGRAPRSVTAIEHYYPKVRLSDTGATMMIGAAVKGYLRNNPDAERVSKKIKYLERRATDPNRDYHDGLLCAMLATTLTDYSTADPEEGGESFDRLLRELLTSEAVNDPIVRKCVKARNLAVHEGQALCDYEVLKFLIWLLITSKIAKTPEKVEDNEDVSREETINAEVKKDLRAKKVSKVYAVIRFIVFVVPLLLFITTFLIALFVGKTDIRKVHWSSHSPQLNARINEAIATKDTTQLFQIQKDLNWINDHLH